MIRTLAATAVAVLGAAAAAHTADTIQITFAGQPARPGEVIALTAQSVAAIDAMHVRVFGREVPAFPVAPSTWRALIGIDLEQPTGEYSAVVDARSGGETSRTTAVLPVRSRTFTTRTLRVSNAFVNPPPTVIARVQAEAKQLEEMWTWSTPERLWNGPFLRPVPDREVSRFGTRTVFNGRPGSPHTGDDFLSPAGTPVSAPNAGRIALAENLYFAGNAIVIDHGMGLFSLLAHLSVVDVRVGDRVVAGQHVGRVGATGRVTGPHLHWAIRLGAARVDPLSLLMLLGQESSLVSDRASVRQP